MGIRHAWAVVPEICYSSFWQEAAEATCSGRGLERATCCCFVEEVAAAAAASGSSAVRFAALDVTTLADLRPDGHPGPYSRKNPFAGGGRVQNDCLHWCMPGPVDTFNQILLQTILRR